MSDILTLIKFYNFDLTKAEERIMRMYEEGKISERLMCAYIQELDNYF